MLTGASAVALSVAASSGQAATPDTPPTWTIWGEGAAFWTGGSSFNIPNIFGPGYTSFKPPVGIEGAFSFDYRWAGRPWHFIFDFRYGKTRSRSASSSSFQSSVVNPTGSLFVTQTSSTSSNATEREYHLVSDFMIGRDLGVGSDRPEFEFGIRIADLYAAVHATVFAKRTFYSGTGTITSAQSSTADWTSRFFGVGPRLAIVGGIPIVGEWSFDYGAGIAALFGWHKFYGLTVDTHSSAFVFNADGWLAVSYLITPQFKLSSGMRGDYYNNALTTYNVGTGGLHNIDRFYWGPFLRLTATF